MKRPSGQIIINYSDQTAEVTPNDGLERESPPKCPHFRFRNIIIVIVICPGPFGRICLWHFEQIEGIGNDWFESGPAKRHRVFNWCILGVGLLSNRAKYSWDEYIFQEQLPWRFLC